MSTDTNIEEIVERHDRQADHIAGAVARLLEQFGPKGLTPDALCEGAIRGGIQAIVTAGATQADVVAILRGMADAVEEGRVVQPVAH